MGKSDRESNQNFVELKKEQAKIEAKMFQTTKTVRKKKWKRR